MTETFAGGILVQRLEAERSREDDDRVLQEPNAAAVGRAPGRDLLVL